MWDPHGAHIGHNYFHMCKKIVLVKENVCKLTTISQHYRMGPIWVPRKKVVVTESADEVH